MIELEIQDEIFLMHAVNKFYKQQGYDGKFNYHEKDETWTLNYDRYENAVIFEDWDVNGDEFVIIRSDDYENFSNEILDSYIEDVVVDEFEYWLDNIEGEKYGQVKSIPYKDYIELNKEKFKREAEQDKLEHYAGYDSYDDVWMTIFDRPDYKTNPHAPWLKTYETYIFFFN